MTIICSLYPGDAQAATALVRESTQPTIASYLPYAQPNAGEYLRVVAQHPQSFPEYKIYVAKSNAVVVGFAEFRVYRDNTAVLSEFFVHAAHRAGGIGKMLLRHLLSENSSVHKLSLDVFDDNIAARRLYASLGFASETTSKWFRRGLPSCGEQNTGMHLVDLHVSLSSLNTYGFCQCQIADSDHTVNFGIVGRSLRLGRRADFRDDELLRTIAGQIPFVGDAHLIELAQEGVGEDAEILARSNRLSVSIPTLSAALEH